MCKYKPVLILGSLQTHAAKMLVEGGVCPCIGCTDFGLPRVVEVYQNIQSLEEPAERVGVRPTGD